VLPGQSQVGYFHTSSTTCLLKLPKVLAAAIQATLGPVAAGSLFAVLQSAAMGGYGAAIVAGTMSSTAVIVAVAGAIHKFVQTNDNLQIEDGDAQGSHSENDAAHQNDAEDEDNEEEDEVYHDAEDTLCKL